MSRTSSPLYDQFYVDKGEGEPIVLLHGLFENLTHWSPVVDYLSKNYRVIIPRLPIFETSRQPSNLEELHKILHELLDWHQLTDITLVGHAAGGQLALMHALKSPQNVSKLIVTGCTFFSENEEEVMPFSEKETLYDETDHALHHQRQTETTLQYTLKAQKKAGYFNSSQKRLSDLLYRIDTPTLLIWGLQNTISSPEVALHLHDLLPHSEIKFIDQCGHLPMTEHPDLFNHYINEFLKKN